MKRFLSIVTLIVALTAGITLSASGSFYGPKGETAFIFTSECVACELCVDECPNGAIFEKDGNFYVNPERCCGGNTCNMICLETCPVGAIWIAKASY